MNDGTPTIRDTEAVERILTRCRTVEFYPVADCGLSKAARAASTLALGARRVGLLLCEDCEHDSRYVVILLRDLPLLVSTLFDELSS